jgi:hypothetical protein
LQVYEAKLLWRSIFLSHLIYPAIAVSGIHRSIPSTVTRTTMIEPIEAEFAIPPVYTDREERALQGQDNETDRESNPSSTTVTSQSPHHHSADPPTEKVQGEIVRFDEGESPREWSAGKKWYVYAAMIG